MKKFTSKEKIALMMGEDIIDIRESISEKDYKLISDIELEAERLKKDLEQTVSSKIIEIKNVETEFNSLKWDYLINI